MRLPITESFYFVTDECMIEKDEKLSLSHWTIINNDCGKARKMAGGRQGGALVVNLWRGDLQK